MHVHEPSRLIYLETPRTASKATAQALKGQASFKTINAPHGRLRGLETRSRWKERVDVPFVREDWTVFTTVRNPFDILVTWCKKYEEPVNESGIIHVLNKSSYLSADPPKLYVHRDDVDGFLRFENIESDLNHVLEAHGLNTVDLPVVNQTEARIGDHYSDYYDEDTIEFVRNRFAEQLDTFNYEYNDAR